MKMRQMTSKDQDKAQLFSDALDRIMEETDLNVLEISAILNDTATAILSDDEEN